jgi:hypothetical protein
MLSNNSAYNKDFYKWTKMQTNFLKQGEFSKLDIDHLIEELDALGRSEKRTLESYLTVLLLHLLKMKYQPNKKTKSWELSVKNSKHKINVLLKENPSLKRLLPTSLDEAYFTARLGAISETGLEDELFPEECPFDLKEIL